MESQKQKPQKLFPCKVLLREVVGGVAPDFGFNLKLGFLSPHLLSFVSRETADLIRQFLFDQILQSSFGRKDSFGSCLQSSFRFVFYANIFCPICCFILQWTGSLQYSHNRSDLQSDLAVVCEGVAHLFDACTSGACFRRGHTATHQSTRNILPTSR